jgi:hypothetical protein
MRTAKAKLEEKGCSAKGGGGGEAEGNECKVTKIQTNLQNKYILVV